MSGETTGNVPAVSVVVPVFNGERTVGRLLKALLSQLPSPLGEHELIFVNNDSTDGTAAILETAGNRVVIVKESKRGAAAARNAGLRAARGKIVAFLDADSVPARTWLREITAPFTDPDVTLVAGGTASFPPKTGAQRFAAAYGLGDALHCVEDPVMPYANTRNMGVRREAALRIGGFAEELPSVEDVDFSVRLREATGCAIEYREAAFAFHDDREDDESLRKQALLYGRGTAAMYERYPQVLPWGTKQRLRRFKRANTRRLIAALASLRLKVRLIDPEAAEFAHYIDMWDTAFWQGFEIERRERAAHAGAAATAAATAK